MARSLPIASAAALASVALAVALPAPAVAEDGEGGAPGGAPGRARPDDEPALGARRALSMTADRLELDLDAGAARGERVLVTSCGGGCRPPWSVSARRAELRDDGDLDLTLLVLRLGRVPVMWLPWLRVRTRRRWGLLMPRLGARAGGGLEAGTGLWLPLGGRRDLSVRVGYLSELIGLESESLYRGPSGWARLAFLGGARGGLQRNVEAAGRLAWRRRRLSVAAELDWTANAGLARALAGSLADEARRTQRSSLSVIWTDGPLRVTLASSVLRDLDAPLAIEAQVPLTGVSASLLPVGAGPFWFGIDASASTLWVAGARDRFWPGWRAVLEPRVVAARALGPLATRWTLASRHAVWDGFEGGASTASRHAVMAGVDLEVPLLRRTARQGRRLIHRLEPAVRYRLALVDTLALPPTFEPPIDPAAWPVAGHLLWLHLRAGVQEISSGRGFLADLAQRVALPTLAGATRPHRVQAAFTLDRRLAAVSLGGGLDEESMMIDEAWVRARIGSAASHGLRLRWRWLDAAAATGLEPDPGALFPVVVPWTLALGAHSVSAEVWLTLAGVVRLEAGAQIDLDHRELLRAGGAILYRHRCGCLALGVEGWYRAGRRWPDVLVTFDLGGMADPLRPDGPRRRGLQ